MPVPNTFANATSAIPLSQLDNNFATAITIGNTAVQLGNTVTTLNNMTLANVTISSVASTFPNSYLTNTSVTIGNTAVSLGGTQTSFGNVTLTNGTISSGQATFAGNSSTVATTITNIFEPSTISATAATGTINYDVTTQSVLYYTSNASANWTVNFRASSGTSLNTAMAANTAVTVVFMVTQGATAYYNSQVQIDGSNVTPKYQGGSAWTAGNASSIDAYAYTIVKTANATFTVFASQTQFK